MVEDLHTTFAAATRAAFASPLRGEFTLTAVEPDAWGAAWLEVRALCFPRDRSTEEDAYTDDERAAFAALGRSLGSAPLSHHLVIRDRTGALVGVVRGSQRLRADWHMSITAIKPAFQGRGIYSELLRRLLPLLRESGFRRITSRHHADNNAVLVPKLKAGFLVTGFEISPKRGLMIELTCPLREGLRAAYSYRIDADRRPPL